jgi:hypothetical protein
MNTMGKILAVCNVLMALATAGFLVVDFATRTNWKKAYDELKRDQVVYQGSRDTSKETNTKLNVENKRLAAAVDTERSKVTEQEMLHKAVITKHADEIREANLKVTTAEVDKQRLQAEIDRLKEETNGLLITLAKREKTIVALENDTKDSLAKATTQTQQAILMQERNQQLLERIRQLTGTIADLQTKGNGNGSNIIRDPNQPNPPTTFVKGKIEKVDSKDRTLVHLSVGTDHGVNKNHTLEAYRTKPRPEYLGTIRIIDSRPHDSVGKLMRSNLPRPPLQEGDIVSSNLSNP